MGGRTGFHTPVSYTHLDVYKRQGKSRGDGEWNEADKRPHAAEAQDNEKEARHQRADQQSSALTEDMTDEAVDEITTILRREHKLKATDDDDFTIRTQQELSSMLNTTTCLLYTSRCV